MKRMARGILNVALAVALAGLAPQAPCQGQGHVQSSLLLLIDISGSMGDAIGSGSPQVKIEAAKQAAITALGRAAKSGSVEVAVLAFAGDCQDPVPRYQDFTSDVDRLTRFVASLQPGGGTPMADALLFANRYMERNGDSAATDRMIMLLADGQNDCGDVARAMATLQASGIIFRHETVGFGITPNSRAAQDLREVATQTGGTYHHAADASQLADVLMEFVDTLSVIDMLGRFGSGSQGARARPGGPPRAAPAPAQGSASRASREATGKGSLSSMIGNIKAKPPAGGGAAAAPATRDAQEVYVAIATSIGPGRVPSQPWRYATGWSESSGNDARIEAVDACSRSAGAACFGAGVPSMRGGCVAMVEGIWLDKDDPQTMLSAVAGTNQSRSLAEQTTLDQCRTAIHSGKPAGTVERYECNLKVSFCSSDVRPR